MKKAILFIMAIGFISIAVAQQSVVPAGVRLVTTGIVSQGQFIDFGGVNLVGSDSLQVTDTIRYIIPITHTNEVTPYYTWDWTKIGAGTATITQTFWTSNDGVKWFPVLKGVAGTAYTKSWTCSATISNEIDFARDTARVDGRYLQVQFITSSTASVKGKIFNRLKVNIK